MSDTDKVTITYRIEITEKTFEEVMVKYAEEVIGCRIQDMRIYYESCLMRDGIVISAEKYND